MSYSLRFIVLFFFSFVVLSGAVADGSESIEQGDKQVISDSLVIETLRRIDSIAAIQTIEANKIAESLLDGLLNSSIGNIELEYDVIYKKIAHLNILSQHKKAIEFIKSLIKRGYTEADLYVVLATEYRRIGEYSKSISSSQEAILIFQEKEDSYGIVDAVNNLIVTYGEIGMFEEAKKYFNDNLKLSNKINYDFGLVKAYSDYGEVLIFENPELSSELLQNGLEIAESVGITTWCPVSVYLIRFYVNTNQLQEAKSAIKDYLLKCGSKNKLRESNVYTLMAHVYSLENNIDSTIFYNNLALDRRILVDNRKMIANSYLNLAGNYLLKEEIKTANEYLEKANRAVHESNNPEMLLTYYRGKVKYFEFIKDYNKAYQFSQKEIELSKEITNQRHQTVLSKLNTSFEIQQKNIRLERELESRKEKTRLLIFILSIVLLLVSGGYLIYLYRKKNYSYLKLASKASHIERKLSISDKERLKFQSIFEYSVTGILILDKNGFIQYSNRKSKVLLDQKDESYISRIPFVDFFESKDKVSMQEALHNVFMKNKAEMGFKVQIFNQKSFHWLDISFAPFVFEQENDNILVTLIDVTQEVINIGREQKQKQELQTLLNSVTESILFIQRNGKINALNNTAASRLESKPEDLKGANYFDMLPKLLRKNRTKMFDKVVVNKEPLIELEMVGNHNNIVSMYPNINSAGEVDYISEFVQDITERRVAEEQIDNLKQRVLRSQMNPHFIFNSLTSIQSFIIRSDATMASKYLNSFARLIRLILESSRHDYISLKNEIDILNYYLDIQKMRFSDNFNFSFEIDPDLDLERIKIPPMLAQPFIENSIEHGIQHLEKMGELNIKFVKKEARLMIELRDNGIGREASEKLNKDNIFASKSLSTAIINDRLTALNKYAKDIISYNIIDLKDEQNEATGTQVIISIPIDYF